MPLPLTAITQIGTSLLAGRGAKRAARKARRETRRRYAEAMEIYNRLARMYEPGGAYGQSLRAGLERRKAIETGAETQRMLAAGLGGTTYGTQVGARWEAGVGRQARMTLEDYLMDKYAGIQREKAGVILGREDIGPSYADIMGAYSGIGEALPAILKGLPQLGKSLGGLFRRRTRQPISQYGAAPRRGIGLVPEY